MNNENIGVPLAEAEQCWSIRLISYNLTYFVLIYQKHVIFNFNFSISFMNKKISISFTNKQIISMRVLSQSKEIMVHILLVHQASMDECIIYCKENLYIVICLSVDKNMCIKPAPPWTKILALPLTFGNCSNGQCSRQCIPTSHPII